MRYSRRGLDRTKRFELHAAIVAFDAVGSRFDDEIGVEQGIAARVQEQPFAANYHSIRIRVQIR
jgi:hypothetical protein